MKQARSADDQIVRISQEADRSPVAEAAKRHGFSESSIGPGARSLRICVRMMCADSGLVAREPLVKVDLGRGRS